MQLTELQESCWTNIGNDTYATKTIRIHALQYYLTYKKHLKQSHTFIENESKIQNLFLISYFIGEKSEVVKDIKGQKVHIAFSINQLIKKHTDYKDCFFHLKQMMKIIKLPEQAKQSQCQINSFMKYFSFVMTYCNKLSSIFDKIKIVHNILEKDLQNIGGQQQYTNKIKYLLWLIFITFRKIQFQNNMDIISNTCLISCLYTYYVTEMYRSQRIVSLYAPDIVQDLGTMPDQYKEVEMQILKYFSLKDIKTYELNRELFLNFIQNISKSIPSLKNPFTTKLINININKLENYYHRCLQIQRNSRSTINTKKEIDFDVHYIDETLFLKNISSNQENLRFTAFGPKRNIGKFNHQQHKSQLYCRRVLNYDQEIKDNQTMTSTKYTKVQETTQKSNDSNFLKIIHKVNVSQTPVILIQATPINQATLAYNWLYSKAQYQKFNLPQNHKLDIQKLVQAGQKSDVYQLNTQQILQKNFLIQGLFNQLLDQYEQITQQDKTICAILSLQVFYFINNITNRDLPELVDSLEVSWYKIWEGIDKLLNYDKTMPNNVKMHLLLIQTSIITNYVWKQQQFINSIDVQDISQAYNKFFYRILHHLAYQIQFIGKYLNISDSLIDQIFILCQYYIKQISFEMKNMNLDVILMCSIYGVCRAKNQDTKFKQIMSTYKNVNSIDDQSFELIQSFQNAQGETTSIINYYNKTFLRNSKGILLKIKQQKLESEQLINSNYLLSPVKSILPSRIVSLSSSNIPSTPSQNQQLFAYNQSPLLKRSKKIQINQYYSIMSNKQNVNCTQLNIRSPSYESQGLRQRANNISDSSKNISEMLQKKCIYFRQQQKFSSSTQRVSWDKTELIQQKNIIEALIESQINRKQNKLASKDHLIQNNILDQRILQIDAQITRQLLN